MTSLDPSIAAFTAFLDAVKAFQAQDRTSLSQDQLQGEAQKLLDILGRPNVAPSGEWDPPFQAFLTEFKTYAHPQLVDRFICAYTRVSLQQTINAYRRDLGFVDARLDTLRNGVNTTKALRDSQGLLDGVADGQLANLGQLIDSQLAMRSRIIERLSAAQINLDTLLQEPPAPNLTPTAPAPMQNAVNSAQAVLYSTQTTPYPAQTMPNFTQTNPTQVTYGVIPAAPNPPEPTPGPSQIVPSFQEYPHSQQFQGIQNAPSNPSIQNVQHNQDEFSHHRNDRSRSNEAPPSKRRKVSPEGSVSNAGSGELSAAKRSKKAGLLGPFIEWEGPCDRCAQLIPERECKMSEEDTKACDGCRSSKKPCVYNGVTANGEIKEGARILARFDGSRFVFSPSLNDKELEKIKARAQEIESKLRPFKVLNASALKRPIHSRPKPTGLPPAAGTSASTATQVIPSPIPSSPTAPASSTAAPSSPPVAQALASTSAPSPLPPAPLPALTPRLGKRQSKPTEKMRASMAIAPLRSRTASIKRVKIQKPKRTPTAPASAPPASTPAAPRPTTRRTRSSAGAPPKFVRARMVCVEIPVRRPLRRPSPTPDVKPPRRQSARIARAGPSRAAPTPRAAPAPRAASPPASVSSAPMSRATAGPSERVDQLVVPLRALYNKTVAEIAVLNTQLESIRSQEVALTGMDFGVYMGGRSVTVPPAVSLEEYLSVSGHVSGPSA